GVERADLLIINKTDLAEHVDVDLERMVADAHKVRGEAPVLALSRKDPQSVQQLCDWVRELYRKYSEGDHTPVDPGPMAPHFHATEEGGYMHTHEHGEHAHDHHHDHG